MIGKLSLAAFLAFASTGMAQSVAHLLLDDRMRRQFGAAAKAVAHERYCDTTIVPMYEAYYEETIDKIAHRRS